jgi:Putative DNA-binding domain
MWEDRQLRDIAEADIRQLVNSGLEEHLQVEYKSALYTPNDNGNKEFLLDVCMFANAGGGILLIGIDERRDANGQPTGMPDPNAVLGVDLFNPEQLLQAYDARVIANIQERLPLELYAVPLASKRHIVAIRMPNSMSKPHRVFYQGRVYLPSRRERQRYEMDIREIKEMVMRTASRLEQAQGNLNAALTAIPEPNDTPSIIMGCIPAFWQNFMVDVRKPEVIQAVSRFNLGHGNHLQPEYNFSGLERRIMANDDSLVQVHRDGMVILDRRLAVGRNGTTLFIRPTAIDIILRAFVQHCSEVYAAAAIAGPFLLTMLLRTVNNTCGYFPSLIPGGEEPGKTIWPGSYSFPVMQADNLLDIDRVIRPLCDQTHQMFGRDASPYFNAVGAWSRP